MKKYLFLAAAAALAAPAFAQQSSFTDEEGLIETVFKMKEKQDKFHLYMNTQTNFDMNWSGEGGTDFDGGRFRFKQLRIEFKGNVNDWISYRYRQRLTGNAFGDFDNVLKSIDIMEVGFRYKKVNFVIGKQCAAYGGIEFDLNPIEVYQYCDMIDYMDNFMTGLRVAWDIKPTQQLQFQILDGTALNPGDMYGANITKAKMPFLYTVNWNGTFGEDVYSTRWSASMMNEVKGRYMWYLAFGNKFNFTPKWGAWLDVMYSREGIDRKGIITSDLAYAMAQPVPDGPASESYSEAQGHNAFNAEYLSLVLHTNYFVHPKWNIFGKVAWERNGVYKASGTPDTSDYIAKGNYGTDWLYVGGVEYYPLKDRGLHFFVTYVGQKTTHSKMAQEQYGARPHSYTNLLTAGFIWQIPLV